MSRITDKEFRELVALVYRESGIVLDDKRELVDARLASLIRKKKYDSPKEILERLKNDDTGRTLIEVLDQVSTNLTYFFREPAHFDFISKVFLPELLKKKEARKSRRIRLWSAASSSGEEPYSIAMTIHEYVGGDSRWDIKILATDISTKVLRKAIEGEYSRQEVSKAPPKLVQRYFHRMGDNLAPVYRVVDPIKKMISFRRFNLLEDAYPFKGRFDLIMCRNVMIYFDGPTKQGLLRRFHQYMDEGAYLLTGHAESLANFEHLFKRINVAVYKK